jgi:cytochrome c
MMVNSKISQRNFFETLYAVGAVLWVWAASAALVWLWAASAAALDAAQAGVPADPKTLKNPVGVTAASIAQGQAVYQRLCARCHGDQGKGDGAQAPEGSHPANLTDAQWNHGSTDGEIFTTIHDGVPPKYDMDSYEGKISDTDIWNIINYIRSIGPPR